MENASKLISNKSIIITITVVLTMAYIGLATIFAKGLSDELKSSTERHGRNSPVSFNYSVKQTNPEDIYRIKHDLEKQLQQANTILNIIEHQKESLESRVMN